jgi:ATP-dependent Lon protease
MKKTLFTTAQEQIKKEETEQESTQQTEELTVSHDATSHSTKRKEAPEPQAKEGHQVFAENCKGLSYEKLFGPYVKDASRIVITDPYIRIFYQVRNLMEFIEMIAKNKAPEDEVAVHLITVPNEFSAEKQQEYLASVEQESMCAGIHFSWEFDGTGNIHARHVVADNGWKISLDRGLDIFQRFEMNDAFSMSNRLQEFRNAKAFEITCMRIPNANQTSDRPHISYLSCIGRPLLVSSY